MPGINTTKQKNHYLTYYAPEIQSMQNMCLPFMKIWGYAFPADWGDRSVPFFAEILFGVLGLPRKTYWRYFNHSAPSMLIFSRPLLPPSQHREKRFPLARDTEESETQKSIMSKNVHLFISPHLDDVVLSCGGYIHRLTTSGEKVVIVTVIAADVPAGRPSFSRDAKATQSLAPEQAPFSALARKMRLPFQF